MPRNFNIGSLVGQLGLKKNDPRTTARVGLGVLLACNLVAGWFVFSPIGGSADEMETRLLDLQRQVSSKQAVLKRSKELAAKVESGNRKAEEREASLRSELQRRDAKIAALEARLEKLERMMEAKGGKQ
jgi:septal ring factor EnvC (AmiA/AmiB activator)